MTLYSTQYLTGVTFARISAAMWPGMESLCLWHCSYVIRAQVALIVAVQNICNVVWLH